MKKKRVSLPLTVSKAVEKEGVTILAPRGSLETGTIMIWENTIREVIDAGTSHIVVDFSGLKYINSAGIGVLIGCIGALRERGGDIVFLNPSEELMSIFDMLGFTKIFKILTDRNEAIASFRTV